MCWWVPQWSWLLRRWSCLRLLLHRSQLIRGFRYKRVCNSLSQHYLFLQLLRRSSDWQMRGNLFFGILCQQLHQYLCENLSFHFLWVQRNTSMPRTLSCFWRPIWRSLHSSLFLYLFKWLFRQPGQPRMCSKMWWRRRWGNSRYKLLGRSLDDFMCGNLSSQDLQLRRKWYKDLCLLVCWTKRFRR